MQKNKYGIVDNGGVNPYESLAFAIIIKAAEDYLLMINSNGKYAVSSVREIERFFRSKFFATITTIDPDRFIAMLKNAAERKNYNIKKPARRVLDGFYSVKQASELIGTREDKIYKAIRAKKLRATKTNGIMQIPRAELMRFQEQQKHRKIDTEADF